LGSLNATQRAAATHLLQVLLSAQGYEKVREIMGADQALADAGTDFPAGLDHYLIAIFGTPNETTPWNDTWFAWSRPTTHEPGKNGTAYYRIQGPKVIIEFAPQATFGDKSMHVHTIYRDPTNEYGAAYLTQ
jgi:hypothetical protein